MNWQKPLFYLLAPLLALIVILQVHFKTDLSAFIIAGDSAEEVLLATEMQSGTLSRRYLISVGAAKDKVVARDFIQQLQSQLQKITGVVEVWSPGQQGNMPETIQALYGSYGNKFYSLHAESQLEQIFSVQGLGQRAETLKAALLSPQASIVKKIALQDPLLLALNGFQTLGRQMQQQLQPNKQYRNLILETAAAGLNASEQSRIQQAIMTAFNTLNQSAKQYQLEMTGVPIFATATQTLIQGDIAKISIISSLALAVLFLVIFRSFAVMFQVFTLLGIVILAAILMTDIVFGYVHGMTIAIGSTLIGICIDYPIHALAHSHSVSVEQKSAVVAKIWPSMLLGGVTTLIGYIALGISGYPGFQQVAVYAATGIILSLLLTRFVLPKLASAKSVKALAIPLVNRWALLCQRFKPVLIILLMIILSLSFYHLKSLKWMQDMQELTPELDYLKQKDKKIRERVTSIEPGRFVLVTGKNIEVTLQHAENVYSVLDDLKQQGQLTDYFGVYPWLLSAQKQQANQALLQHYLTADNLLLWQQALKQQGLSVKKLGHFDYPENESLTLEAVRATSLKRLLDSHIIVGKNQTLLMVWLAEHQADALKTALSNIEYAQYFSQRDMLNNMTQDYTERAKTLLSAGLGLIVLILLWRYKNVIKMLQTLLPSMLAAFIIITVWSVTGAAISFLHLVGFLLVVAICVDYGIFYQENRGGDSQLTYQAMAASMLTSAVAFASLMLAESTSLQILSGVVTFGVVLGFILCPIIINPEKVMEK